MTPLPAVPNALRVRLTWTTGGGPPINCNFFVSYTGGTPTSTDLNAYASDVIAAAASYLATEWTTDLALTKVEVFDLSSSSGALGEASASVSGSRTAGGMSNATCVVAHYLINRRYRGGKPRNYWPFGDAGEYASRVAWTPAFVAACQSALGSFFAAVVGKTHGSTSINNHINISYYQGFTTVTDPLTHRSRDVPTKRSVPLVDGVVGITVSSVPGTQRRRL
jgi:hypothetical protein